VLQHPRSTALTTTLGGPTVRDHLGRHGAHQPDGTPGTRPATTRFIPTVASHTNDPTPTPGPTTALIHDDVIILVRRDAQHRVVAPTSKLAFAHWWKTTAADRLWTIT